MIRGVTDTDDLGPSTVLGYPRIGPRRELKRALEDHWAGRTSRADLGATARAIRRRTWRTMAGKGLGSMPSHTFSLYDHVLDAAVMLDAIPRRFLDADDPYFAMARGDGRHAPLRMTKWFDTNYHYIVPEIGPDTPIAATGSQAADEYREALGLGYDTRPVLLGPVTFLLLADAAPDSPHGFRPVDRLDNILDAYEHILAGLHIAGAKWVQLDEPALVAERTDAELGRAVTAYERLAASSDRPRILAATYFGDAPTGLARTGIEALAVDLVRGAAPNPVAVEDVRLVAGVVSGRDVWRTDPDAALAVLARYGDDTVVSASCPLLHVPHDLDLETDLDPHLRDRLAFADQKLDELVWIARRRAAGDAGRPAPAPASGTTSRRDGRRSPYPQRAAAQAALGLPALPVTTIGSFPQTGELRAARAALAAGTLTEEAYDDRIRAEIDRVVRLQERLGLDVLVHGEPERNDMVEYFAQHLDGFATTRHGWVQSYGSRCTRPPILHGDVHRRGPVTTRWATYAQRQTTKPVKGMLTGPVTIVAWSFVRRDIPLAEVTGQVADAIREEVRDLELQGIRIIQVDEPALRELLPLKAERRDEYLQWAVGAYRHATAGAADGTQIHTHLCYSDAAEVLDAIDALDADVTTIESARSGGRILGEPAMTRFARGIGPGVYDIHSPRVPGIDEVEDRIREAAERVGTNRLWVNPDCGLKTRAYAEVEAALANLVEAAARARRYPTDAGASAGVTDATAGRRRVRRSNNDMPAATTASAPATYQARS
jgi:5-methyltetrahydropteroyltriglutamate--homocysteine methyltransferase